MLPAEVSRYLLVTVADAGTTVAAFATPAELAAAIRVQDGADAPAEVFAFRGERLAITRGPHRFLRIPEHPPIPLFEPPAADADEDDLPVVGGHATAYATLTAAVAAAQDARVDGPPVPADDGDDAAPLDD